MLIQCTTLARFNADAGDDTLKLHDLFIDPTSWRLTHLTLDTGGWFDSDISLVAASLIDGIDREERRVRLSLSKADLDAAPRLHDVSPSITSMPPLIVGPFGGTFSPLMATAALAAQDEGQDARPAVLGDSQAMRDLIQLPVFGSDGELGPLEDLLLDTDTGRASHIVVNTGTILPGPQRVIPVEKVRYIADRKTHFVAELTKDQLEHAPQVEDLDQIDTTWLTTARTYFGLPL